MTGDLFGNAAASQPVEPEQKKGPESGTYLAAVRDQYEDLPYPPYDAEWDKFRFVVAFKAQLDVITHYGFGGRRDLRSGAPRVLVAGGGTGSTTIAMAEQLRDNPKAEIVYVDMSSASMKVAQRRAEIRGLTNIRWIHDSLLNIPKLGLGKFDFIDCAGVLHHLEDPDAGLAALASALDEDGVMSIMLYGYYGRISIYIMQELMRRINIGIEDKQKKIDHVRALMKGGLPRSNPFTRDYQRFAGDLATDGGIYDLLLHSQDRAYTIPQLYDFAEGAGLKLNKIFTLDLAMGSVSLDPALYIKDLDLLSHVITLPLREQQAIAELMLASAHKQECYLSFKERKEPDWKEDMDLVPALSSVFDDTAYEQMRELFSRAQSGQVVEIKPPMQKFSTRVEVTPCMHLLTKYFDGKRSVKDIFRKVMETPEGKKSGANFVSLTEEFRKFYDAFHPLQWINLRHADIAPFTPLSATLRRIQSQYPGAMEAYAAQLRARNATPEEYVLAGVPLEKK